MAEDRKEITRRILDFTLEILYLLTGEDYTIVKKALGDSVTPIIHLQESGGWSRSHFPITEPPSPIHEQKILELTNKMMELLTGEVPIRCQDVAVYFSMEEWEYIGGHQDLYEDVMMEDHRPLTSQDGASRRNPPERCPHPLYSQDCPEEEPNVPKDYQGENLIAIKGKVTDEEKMDLRANQQYRLNKRNPPERCPRPLNSQDYPEEDSDAPEIYQGEDVTAIKVKVEEEWMMDDHLWMRDVKEEIPVNVTPENPSKNSEGNFMLSLSCKVEDEDIPQHSLGENLISLNVHPGLYNTDLSNSSPNYEEFFPDRFQVVTTSAGQKERKRIQCDECGKQFTKSSSLYMHKRIHTGERPYSCLECGKCFAKKSHLVVHERVHTGEKPFSCSDCRKCFSVKSSLVIHQRGHTGEKPFSCSECGKCFINKTKLTIHQRIHTGEKPFSCRECGKSFIKKSDLVQHERIHTGEKPYSCSACGKCFANKSDLVIHERIHTGEKPFSCSECGKCFAKKSDLVQHERIHTGERPHLCSFCGKCFTHKSSHLQHERTHTGTQLFYEESFYNEIKFLNSENSH